MPILGAAPRRLRRALPVAAIAVATGLGGCATDAGSTGRATDQSTGDQGGDTGGWCSRTPDEVVLPASLARGERFRAVLPPGPEVVAQQLTFVDPEGCREAYWTYHNGRRVVVQQVPEGDWSGLTLMGPPGTLAGLVPADLTPGEWLVCDQERRSCGSATVR